MDPIMDSLPSAPPGYTEVAGPNETSLEGELSNVVVEPPTSDSNPLVGGQPDNGGIDVAPISPQQNHFDIMRFILCWTGLATELSAVTCRLCGCWYTFLGGFGIVNIILPYALLGSEWPNSLLALYIMAGVSCILVCLMWFCTLRFFSKHHPYRRLYDTHNYRVPGHVNSGPIVCCFLISCGIFGGITIALLHNLIFICHLFDPPVLCSVSPYVIFVTSSMGVIVVLFLCLNCFCYCYFFTRNAGDIC